MCEHCTTTTIEGRTYHEAGCPDAWKDERRACHACGGMFTPEARRDITCSDECAEAYHGF